MSLNKAGRPTRLSENQTFDSAHAAQKSTLLPEEQLLFEVGSRDVSGVDLPEFEIDDAMLGGQARKSELSLPGLSEPQAMRHYVRLSRLNYSIDAGMYPLGSCTMKHNPRLNEKMARMDGFANIHPMQPTSSVPGALQLMQELAEWLMKLTNMSAVALSPKAGAHGEMCGMMAIKAAHEAKGQGRRNIVLVPQNAHGTNPATAAFLGYKVRPIAARDDGTVSLQSVKDELGPDVAAIMLTNPNTCGLFEPQIKKIADAVHEAGAYFYCDGANFNAIMGVVRPGDCGVDAMHINLHKTFSTPHGGGGPGAGPVVLSQALAPFAPLPFVQSEGGKTSLVEHQNEGSEPFGRLSAFHGQFGTFVRAYAYMLSHGGDGLKQAAQDAVLNANYLKSRLQDHFSMPFGEQFCMHEVLCDDATLEGTGVTTLDFAKAMIDEGYHPMTMYFPLVVNGAMLIEPTESESKASLDAFADTMIELAEAAKNGQTERFTTAPQFAPLKRVDETQAARQPKLVWKADSDQENA